jgi:hypothetical protein
LLDQPSLEGVFTRFTGEEASHDLASRILAVMQS